MCTEEGLLILWCLCCRDIIILDYTTSVLASGKFIVSSALPRSKCTMIIITAQATDRVEDGGQKTI